jgi:imidazolonepropionase-like amidohydrolase
MEVYHFKNFEMLAPDAGELLGGHELIVEGDRIKEASAKPVTLTDASVIDCGGDGEVSTVVEEATTFGRCVCAHAYSAAITRAARLGVRTIEHGNLRPTRPCGTPARDGRRRGLHRCRSCPSRSSSRYG